MIDPAYGKNRQAIWKCKVSLNPRKSYALKATSKILNTDVMPGVLIRSKAC